MNRFALNWNGFGILVFNKWLVFVGEIDFGISWAVILFDQVVFKWHMPKG